MINVHHCIQLSWHIITSYDKITHRKYKEIHYMMGYQEHTQEEIFLYNIYLETKSTKRAPITENKGAC